MLDEEIYRKAIKKLFQKYGKFEHDEEKAIELFDKLLDQGIESDCSTVEQLCFEADFDKNTSEEIAKIYNIISLYKKYKKNPMNCWGTFISKYVDKSAKYV
jgi:hypothetical protein